MTSATHTSLANSQSGACRFHRPKPSKVINDFEVFFNRTPATKPTKEEAAIERNRQLNLAAYHRRQAQKKAERVLKDNTNNSFCTPIATQADRDRTNAIRGRSNGARSQ